MGSRDLVRIFVCIEIPAEIRNRIEALQNGLKQTGAEVSWTKAANIHLTLKFLGNVATSKLNTVCTAVEEAVQGKRVFPIQVSETGCFPSPRNPRVLWIGVNSPTGTLQALQTSLETNLARLGFAKETRPFQPHLTIGRVKSQRNAGRLVTALVEEGFESVTFQAHEVIVMRSDLRPTGALYTPQVTVRLSESAE
jgi:2'-5' RNA ligase